MLSTNSVTFCLPGDALISESFLKDDFVSYRILGWISFGTMSMFSHCLPAFLVSAEELLAWVVSLADKLLVAFQILGLFLTVWLSCIQMCISSCLFFQSSLSLNVYINMFHQTLDVFRHYFFANSSNSFLPLFSFASRWDIIKHTSIGDLSSLSQLFLPTAQPYCCVCLVKFSFLLVFSFKFCFSFRISIWFLLVISTLLISSNRQRNFLIL